MVNMHIRWGQVNMPCNPPSIIGIQWCNWLMHLANVMVKQGRVNKAIKIREFEYYIFTQIWDDFSKINDLEFLKYGK